MNRREPSHPGVILKEEFMDVYKLDVNDMTILAKLSPPVINSLLKGDYSLSYGVAARLGKVFGTTTEFWMTLQWEHDKWSLETNSLYMDSFNKLQTVDEYLKLKGGVQ